MKQIHVTADNVNQVLSELTVNGAKDEVELRDQAGLHAGKITITTRRGSDPYLHVEGSRFELAVWSALMNVRMGDVVSYGDLAEMIGKPKTAGRAVGTAVAKNLIAFLIPCHRVIKGSGYFGMYAWGSMRKGALIGWEATCVYSEPEVRPNDDLVN